MRIIKFVFVLDMNRLSERKNGGHVLIICPCLHGIESFFDDYDATSLIKIYIYMYFRSRGSGRRRQTPVDKLKKKRTDTD